MDQPTTISLVVAVGSLSAVIFGYLGYTRGIKREFKLEGKDMGYMESNIKNIETNITYIMRRSDDLLLEQKDTNKNLNALAERVTRVEESTKSAHKRIDLLEEGERRNDRSSCD